VAFGEEEEGEIFNDARMKEFWDSVMEEWLDGQGSRKDLSFRCCDGMGWDASSLLNDNEKAGIHIATASTQIT
jgi:hypothetical protein